MAKAEFSSLKSAHHEYANMTRFRGDPEEDPREFIYRFETISNCFDVSDVMRLVTFLLVLTDQALMWFHGLSPSQKDTIDKVIDLFKEKYTRRNVIIRAAFKTLCCEGRAPTKPHIDSLGICDEHATTSRGQNMI